MAILGRRSSELIPFYTEWVVPKFFEGQNLNYFLL